MLERPGTGRALIMAGTLDDKAQFKPEAGLFCEQAPAWVEMVKECQNFPRSYP